MKEQIEYDKILVHLLSCGFTIEKEWKESIELKRDGLNAHLTKDWTPEKYWRAILEISVRKNVSINSYEELEKLTSGLKIERKSPEILKPKEKRNNYDSGNDHWSEAFDNAIARGDL